MSLLDDGVDVLSPWREHQLRGNPVETVAVDKILPGDSPRTEGENADHIRALISVDGRLPPIVVHRPTMRVIDGMHRLRAAAMRADRTIEVRFFDGDADDAFVLAVEANVGNGLPLTLADRRAAATRIIATHPNRSDRWIALVSGLAANTVGAIRKCSTVQDAQSNTRIGRDGRVRPLDSSDGRRLAAQLIVANPEWSLRDVARAAGIAPSTALDVRNRLRSGADPVPAGREVKSAPAEQDARSVRRRKTTAAESEVDPDAILRALRNDPSLRFTDVGRRLLRWLDAHTVDKQPAAPPVQGIPAHCIGSIVALARHNARFWTMFSEYLNEVQKDSQLP